MAFPKLVVFFVFSPLFANSRNRPVPANLRIPKHCAARSPRRRWGDVLRQLGQRAPGRNYSPRNGLRRWVAAAGRRANFRNRHLSYNRLKNKLMRRRQIRRKLKSGRRAPWGGACANLGNAAAVAAVSATQCFSNRCRALSRVWAAPRRQGGFARRGRGGLFSQTTISQLFVRSFPGVGAPVRRRSSQLFFM